MTVSPQLVDLSNNSRSQSLRSDPDLPIGNWQLDLISDKLHWSDSQYKIYGYQPHEFTLDNKFFITNTTHPVDVDRVSKIITEALEKHDSYTFKRCIIKKNGFLGYVETKAKILRQQCGKPNKIVGTTIDISIESPRGIIKHNELLVFKNLFKNYRKAIFSEIYKLVGEKDISKDLCQEVFIKAWRNLSKYNEEKGKPYTWLINIARNHCKDYFRSKHFRALQSSSSVDYIPQSFIRCDSFNLDKLDIDRLLTKLLPAEKEVIELLFFEGFTHEEVSQMKNMPLGTVKTRSRCGINKLRKCLGVSIA